MAAPCADDVFNQGIAGRTGSWRLCSCRKLQITNVCNCAWIVQL